MDVSIILCTYNRSNSLEVVLDDLANLNVSDNLSHEILIIDNNSTDDTKRVVESAINKKPHVFRYIFEAKQGKSFALNSGLRCASGRILAFTDDDVRIDQEWLSEIVSCFGSSNCRSVGGRILPLWHFPKPAWYEEEGPGGSGAVVKLDFGNDPCEISLPVWGANMAFLREVFDQYGMFREDLGPNPDNLIRGEDSEFCRRILSAQEKILYAPKAVVHHPVHKERATKEYLLAWSFNLGRAQVRMKPPSTHEFVSYFGIPRYYYRMMVEIAVRWLSTANSRQRFGHKRRFYELAGEVVEFRAGRKR